MTKQKAMLQVSTLQVNNSGTLVNATNSYENVVKELRQHGYNPALMVMNDTPFGISIDCTSMFQYKHSEFIKSVLGGRGFKVTCLPNSDTIQIK